MQQAWCVGRIWSMPTRSRMYLIEAVIAFAWQVALGRALVTGYRVCKVRQFMAASHLTGLHKAQVAPVAE